ncbi:hypothetical protein HDV05_000356, partial [Chytridiales sp. JEL 0842]
VMDYMSRMGSQDANEILRIDLSDLNRHGVNTGTSGKIAFRGVQKASLIINAFGETRNNVTVDLDLATARSFLLDERAPTGFTPATTISLAKIQFVAGTIANATDMIPPSDGVL